MTAHSLGSSSFRRIAAPRLILPIALGAVVQASLVMIAMLVRVAKRLVRGVQNRRAAAALAHLDAHMLADIGLTRSDVRDATAAPMWDDPTTLLRTRALERRLRRHRLDLGFHDQSKR